jgi:hypothetical protein
MTTVVMGMVVNKKFLEQEKEKEKERGNAGGTDGSNNNTSWWIECLLQIGIDDFRKRAVSLILVPYLLHKKRLPEDQITDIIRDWLVNKCYPEKRLDFKPDSRIRDAIYYSKQSKILHMKFDTLKEQNPTLYHRIREQQQQQQQQGSTTTA